MNSESQSDRIKKMRISLNRYFSSSELNEIKLFYMKMYLKTKNNYNFNYLSFLYSISYLLEVMTIQELKKLKK